MGVSEGISQFKFYRFQLKGPQGKGELPLGVGLALLALQQVARAPGLELEVRLEGHPGVPALLLVEAQNQRAAVLGQASKVTPGTSPCHRPPRGAVSPWNTRGGSLSSQASWSTAAWYHSPLWGNKA